MSTGQDDPKRHSRPYREEHQPPETGGQGQGDGPPEEKKQEESRRGPKQWESLINQRIEEAMARGEFDNLRGKGKPIDTSPDPYVPPDMQMANSLLKNNDLSPAWIGDRAAVLGLIERFREKLRSVTADFARARAEAATPQAGRQLDELWDRYAASWKAEIVEINKRILTQNLKQPVTFLEIVPLRLEDELRRAKS